MSQSLEVEPFADLLSKFIYKRTYARWLPMEQRREEWHETVRRAAHYLFSKVELTPEERNDIQTAMYNQEAMCSMRLFWSAGPAAEATNVAAYNCAYEEVDCVESFAEILYILMCGTGVGAGVEEESVSKLPRIMHRSPYKHLLKHTVKDSREGWADALKYGMQSWYDGFNIEFDFSALRPAGARLETMGGRSSGPEPLKRLLKFVDERMASRTSRQLRTIDVADIVNMIGECVVAGGVRRSSEILLFSSDDALMAKAKHGAFYNAHPYRRMANNSMAFNEKPSTEEFMHFWLELMEGKSGEPGIFNRASIRSTSPRRKPWHSWGTNPCGEIFLRGNHRDGGGQFCNLSEAIARADDTLELLGEKVRIAAIIGTIQATLTNFPYLRKGWKANCEEERLLGVSITGEADCPLFDNKDGNAKRNWAYLQAVAVSTNAEYSARFGIAQAAAVTCQKPSGTLSKMVRSSSGGHVRWSDWYIQNIRINATDPLLELMRQSGVPAQPEVGQDAATASTWVLSFPVASPVGAVTRKDVSALSQLASWGYCKTYYTEHNPSRTIYVKDDEWVGVMNWVWDNWDIIGGLSFFPSDDHVYPLAPYQEITEEEYKTLLSTFPTDIDYDLLQSLESDDNTTGARELACAGGNCEI